MATLDVSEVFDDLMCDAFTVVRRAESINSVGRNVFALTYFNDVLGSVQPKDSAIGGNEIERQPNVQFRGAALEIITPFRLRSTSKENGVQYQPDVVYWNSDPFVVTLINDYSQYGAGYIHAELASMEAEDAPPPEPAPAAEVDE